MLRPTRQARAGFRSPSHLPPGVSARFGRNAEYKNGKVDHHGQDYFWLSAASAAKLGISQAASQQVLACVAGPVYQVHTTGLGYGAWQQIDATHRIYYWHLRKGSYKLAHGASATTQTVIADMGNTGTAAGTAVHLHVEVRKAPYREADRIDPEPFFNSSSPAGGGTTPIVSQEDDAMLLFYTKDGPAGSNGLRYHLLSGGGVYTFTSGGSAFPNAVASAVGHNAIFCEAAFIESLKGQYRAQNPGATAGIDATKLAEAIAAELKGVVAPTAADIAAALRPLFAELGAKVDALPREIDLYADGKKQS